jgi:hypothetical protein
VLPPAEPGACLNLCGRPAEIFLSAQARRSGPSVAKVRFAQGPDLLKELSLGLPVVVA